MFTPQILVPRENNAGLYERRAPINSFEHEIPLVPCNDAASGFQFGFGSGQTVFGVVQTSVATANISLSAVFAVPYCPDPWFTLTEVRAEVSGRLPGAPAHAALPARMPLISLIEVVFGGAISIVLTGTDQSINVASYDIVHSIATNSRLPVANSGDPLLALNPNAGGTGLLQLAAKSQFVCIQGEASTNSQIESFYIRRIWGTWTRG